MQLDTKRKNSITHVAIAAASEPGSWVYKTRNINNPQNSQIALLVRVMTEIIYFPAALYPHTYLKYYLYKPTPFDDNSHLMGTWHVIERRNTAYNYFLSNLARETSWEITHQLTNQDLVLDLRDKLQEFLAERGLGVG